jgi:hypothetical protein
MDLPLLVVLWVLLEKKFAWNWLFNKSSICDDFKIWWCKNDGAAYSLMQLAKASAKLAPWAQIPYISLCTDPTTGGTTASYAMLGDMWRTWCINRFAGPRL